FVLFLFFFFQAEDGIRDRNVTGVQTCALPISGSARCRSQMSSPAWRYQKIPGVSSPLRCQGVCAAVRRLHAPCAAPSGSHTPPGDRKSTRLNSSHVSISYAVFCLKKKYIYIVI